MDSIRSLTKFLLPKENHELLNYEGLLALVNASSLNDNVREKIMLEGGYQAAKELCFEKNEKIVRVALELMGNLSVCESLQLRIFKDQMKQDIILMI